MNLRGFGGIPPGTLLAAYPTFSTAPNRPKVNWLCLQARPGFLSTDTISALEMPGVQRLRASGKLRVLEEADGWKLAHVDRSHANLGLQGFVDSYVAYMLLASAQVLILSRSFFGETAAEIGAVPHVYFAEGCVRTDMRSS